MSELGKNGAGGALNLNEELAIVRKTIGDLEKRIKQLEESLEKIPLDEFGNSTFCVRAVSRADTTWHDLQQRLSVLEQRLLELQKKENKLMDLLYPSASSAAPVTGNALEVIASEMKAMSSGFSAMSSTMSSGFSAMSSTMSSLLHSSLSSSPHTTPTTTRECYNEYVSRGAVKFEIRQLHAAKHLKRSEFKPKETPWSEPEVQKFWNELVNRYNKRKDNPWELADTHRNRYLKSPNTFGIGLAPDIGAVPQGSSVHPYNISFIGELKGKDVGVTDDARGQLFKYIEILHQNQLDRRDFYGFITDNDIFELWRLTFDDRDSAVASSVTQIVCATFVDPSAWDTIEYLLFSSSSDVGLPRLDPHIQEKFVSTTYLGSGASADSFYCTRKNADSGQVETVVVKSYERNPGGVDIECQALAKLKEQGVNHVPQCLEHVSDDDADTYYTVTVPYGMRFDKSHVFTGRHAAQLIRVVQQAHQAGLVHNDIAKRNIYYVGDDILVNDWSGSSRNSATQSRVKDLKNAVELIIVMWGVQTLRRVLDDYENMRQSARDLNYDAIVEAIQRLAGV